MKLIRYEYPPVPTLPTLERLFDQSFRDLARWSNLLEPTAAFVPADLYEDADAYHVRFELPGYRKEDIKVELENAVLSVSGERPARGEERPATTFTRSLSVPDGINPDRIKAKLEDGLLTVTLPKAEHRKPKQIDIA